MLPATLAERAKQGPGAGGAERRVMKLTGINHLAFITEDMEQTIRFAARHGIVRIGQGES